MRRFSSISLAASLATIVLTGGCGGGSPSPAPADLASTPADLTVIPDMAITKPAAPTNLTVTALVGGAHSTWKDNSSDEDGFMLMRKEGAGAYMEVATVPFNTTSYHDAPLTSGKTFTYTVHAVKGGVASDDSKEVTVTIK